MVSVQAAIDAPSRNGDLAVIPGGKEVDLAFQDLAGLRACAARLDTVLSIRPVAVGRLQFPDERGLVFASNNYPIRTVSKHYKVVQNPWILEELADQLEAMGLDPWGTITQTPYGHLVAQVYVKNPEYRLHVALDSVDEESYITLGVAVENSYARPNTSRRIEAIGYAPRDDDVLYFRRLIGHVSMPHVGRVLERTGEALQLLTRQAPQAARHIAQAARHTFGEGDAELALRGLGFSKPLTLDLLEAGPELTSDYTVPVTAWGLYKALLSYHRGRKTAPAAQADVLRRAERILQSWELPGLVKKGRQVVAREHLEDAPTNGVAAALEDSG